MRQSAEVGEWVWTSARVWGMLGDMDDKLILYVGEKNVSSWSMRGFLALEVKGVPYEERTISLAEDSDRSRRRKVSPTGKVPVLHAGNLVIPDSLAIVEFLEETFPPPRYPALWPKDREDRAHARWLAAAMHSGFSKLRESMSFNLCFLSRRPTASAEALREAEEMLSYWEDALARKEARDTLRLGTAPSSGAPPAPRVVTVNSSREAADLFESIDWTRKDAPSSGPFLFGPFTAADVMYAPAVVRLKAFEVPAAETPMAAVYMDAVLAYPPVKKWMDAARALPPRESY